MKKYDFSSDTKISESLKKSEQTQPRLFKTTDIIALFLSYIKLGQYSWSMHLLHFIIRQKKKFVLPF